MLTSSTKRTFCTKGKVNPLQHFFVNTEAWNEKRLLPLIEQRSNITLVAPTRTGKTTRVLTLQQLLLVNEDILPIYIDLESYGKAGSANFFEHFVDLLQQNIESVTGKNVVVTAQNFSELFDEKAKYQWYFGKDIVLLIDNIDKLTHATEEERSSFLRHTRYHKQNSSRLRAILVATNCTNECLIDPLGNASFSVGMFVVAPYFSLDEVKVLFQQYADQEGASLDYRIIKSIYEQTSGAPGLVAVYGEFLDRLRTELKREPTFSEWFTRCNSSEYESEILQSPIYQEMMVYMQKEDVQTVLLQKLYGFELGLFVPSDLFESNILTQRSQEFANPFVKRIATNFFHAASAAPSNYKVPLLSDSQQIDFLKIIEDSLYCINPVEITGAYPKKVQILFQQPIVSVSKEVVYILALKRALEKLLPSISITLYCPEEDSDKEYCDILIRLSDETIAVENAIEPDNDRIQHLVKQAEICHKGLKATQTWLIVWVNTTSIAYANKQLQYNIPESDGVRIVYIYHDMYFRHIQLVAKETRQFRITPVVREPCTIRRQTTGESETKRRRLNDTISEKGKLVLRIDVRKYEKKQGCISVPISDKVRGVNQVLDMICDSFKEDRGTRVTLRTADEKERLVQDIKLLQEGVLYHALRQEQEDEY